MANMFKCALAGGGDGASLIVTCTQNFAGSTITLTNGVKTYTQVCPLSSPYEVTFESVATGVWTVSGIAQGQTFSTSVTITDFEALLADIPEGSTVTPTDDIQIWLHCANIWNKTYTTISQVLSDSSTLQALIASNNAADYMARSTTWASNVTADSSAMTYIGLNDYCSDALLADSTWLTAICNSTYFESVLNVKVPTMTSNTTPSGECSASSVSNNKQPYLVFNGTAKDENDGWNPTSGFPQWLCYDFVNPVSIKKMYLMNRKLSTPMGPKTFKIQAYNGTDWIDITETITNSNQSGSGTSTYNFLNNEKYSKYRIYVISGLGTHGCFIEQLQFYGRA